MSLIHCHPRLANLRENPMKHVAIISNFVLLSSFTYLVGMHREQWTLSENLASILIYVSTLSSLAVLFCCENLPNAWMAILHRLFPKMLLVAFICALVGIGAGIIIEKTEYPCVKIREIGVVNLNGVAPSNETIETVNKELQKHLSLILGEERAQQNMVIVTPMVSSYEIWLVGPSNSKIWDEAVRRSLYDWVIQRVDELDTEHRKRRNPLRDP